MAYRSHTASPAGSQSPSSSSSTNVSPYINTTPLDSMVPTDDPDSSYSAHGTPNHTTSSLPRTLNAGKGGCWTCRVRRKKCDEQREGDSCRTCRRLTIKCLGWGAKRPDWMRDKKNVDNYKASIKAQLSRAGLIRGQPRHNTIQVPSQRGMQQIRQSPHHNPSNPRSGFETTFRHPVEPSFTQNQNTNHLMSGLPGVPTSGFDDSSRGFEPFDPTTSFYQNPLFNPSLAPSTPNAQEFSLLHPTHDTLFQDPSFIPPYHAPPGQTTIHEELVMHYFHNVQKVQPFFAGGALTNVTYQAIVEEPRGAVTLAICALADLHSKQVRVSQGLEAHSQNTENSSTAYLRNEALLRLENNNNTHGCWSESDAIAALHLVSLSQLSGGGSDWETPFSILCQWLLQFNLHLAENPWMAFLNLSPNAQHYVKATLWLDIFSSISVLRPPKFMILWQSLLSEHRNFWVNGNELEMRSTNALKMDTLTGCPDAAMLAIAEVSSLAQWKASQVHNKCLSYPELIRRGTIIEQQLRRSQEQDGPQTRVHGTANTAQPTEEDRSLIANIFRETAILYLHTVLSNSTPGVPEISASVETIVRLFDKLPRSELDRSLVFPICLAGCMTDDSTRRDFFKSRICALDECYGNLRQTRRLMETVWQKRDVGGKEVDIRETIGEQRLKLLLI